MDRGRTGLSTNGDDDDDPRRAHRVTVIIPTHDREHGLRRCLEALFDSDLTGIEAEIRVVDDGSGPATASTVAELRERCPSGMRLHYQRQKRGGPSAARNLGALSSDTELLFFLDDDCEPDPSWLRELARAEWSEEVGVVAGTIHGARGGNWVARYCRQAGYNDFPARGDRSERVRFANTANCAVRRDVFGKVGGFDTMFSRVGFEDVDFSRRVLLHGYGLSFRPEAVVRHHHREEASALWHAYRKRGRARVLLDVMWDACAPCGRREVAAETIGVLACGLRLLWVPVQARHWHGEGQGLDPFRFAFLEWLTDLARCVGRLDMLVRIRTGRQSLVRSCTMPEYQGTLREALRDARRPRRGGAPMAR